MLFVRNPIARKRWQRFRKMRRAWYSFCLLLILFFVSLAAELVCNSKPLAIIHKGKLYFPFCKFYPESTFIDNAQIKHIDYKKLAKNENFKQNSKVFWAPFRSDPLSSISIESLESELRVFCRLTAIPKVLGISLNKELQIIRAAGFESLNTEEKLELYENTLQDFWEIPQELKKAIEDRFSSDEQLPKIEVLCKGKGKIPDMLAILLAFDPTRRRARNVRLTLREQSKESLLHYSWKFRKDSKLPINKKKLFATLPAESQEQINSSVQKVFLGEELDTSELEISGQTMQFSIEREKVRFPFRPVKGHLLGLDDAGRDVFARILYGIRSSLCFALILVTCSLTVGTLAGMLQGYIGGWVDISGQRLIEIWSAMPFLYIMILMGSIYGPSFSLLIFCYAIFNWIGISYYMRAEMLRLRSQPFVEAARCLGLPGWKIALKHILPNSLVPLITFFPFSLIGAIGSLAALDYLGFGLPPPTPSLGQLLQQAQNQRWAWWLTLYPSLSLFIIMLLGVFIGEGLRNAFDPRRHSRIE